MERKEDEEEQNVKEEEKASQGKMNSKSSLYINVQYESRCSYWLVMQVLVAFYCNHFITAFKCLYFYLCF